MKKSLLFPFSLTCCLLLAGDCDPPTLEESCQLDPNCTVINDDGDGIITSEMQAAWNSAVYVRGVANPSFVMATHSGDWIVDERVRFCADATPPAGDGRPDCDGGPFTGQIAMIGDFRFECDFTDQGLVQAIPGLTYDACLWIGDGGQDAPIDPAVAPIVLGEITVSAGVDFLEIPYLIGVTPFLCDGCGTYASFIIHWSVEEDVRNGSKTILTGGLGTAPILIGGTGDVTIDQVGALGTVEAPILKGPHQGTRLHGNVSGLQVNQCDYGPAPAEPYQCDLVLASDLVVEDTIVFGDDGNLVSDAQITAPGVEPPLWLDWRNNTDDELGTFDIGGTMINNTGNHPCVRVNGDIVSRTVPPAVTLRGGCQNTTMGMLEGFFRCNQGAPEAMLIDVWHVADSAWLTTGSNNQHMISRNFSCGITSDRDVEEIFTVGGLAPAETLTPVTGVIESGTNGNSRNLTLPTVTDDQGSFGTVLPGDRFRFTAGPFAWEDRVVVTIAGTTLTLSGAEFGDVAGGVVNQPYEIVRPVCFDGVGWTACDAHGGSGTDLHVAAASEVATSGRVRLLQDVSDTSVSCHLTWVRNGIDQLGFEYFANETAGLGGGIKPKEDPSWNLGGGAADNFFTALRSNGEEEFRMITDGLEPGDFVELQLSPGPDDSCADGSGCGCFGKNLGQVEMSITTFTDKFSP